VVEVLGFLGEWCFRPTTHIPIDSKGKFHHEFKKPNVIVFDCPFGIHFKGNQ
jgi:hypothetical protein